MSKRSTAGVAICLGILVAGISRTAFASGSPAQPEASPDVVQALSRAMGDESAHVPADLGPSSPDKTPSFGSLMARVAGVLIFILGLLYVSLLGMKRLAGKRPPAQGEQIRVLGRTPLSPKANVYLLRFGDRYLVVGEAGDRLTSLASLPVRDHPEIEEEVSPEASAGEESDAFSASLDRQQFSLASEGTLRRIAQGVKKLRQETEKLLNIQNGRSVGSPPKGIFRVQKDREGTRTVGAEAP